MRRRTFLSAAAAASAIPLVGCGGDSDSGSGTGTIKVAYQKFGNFTQADELFKDVKKTFEEANSGSTLELVPIEASQNDYFTKLALMNRSPSTAPDVMYEDTYMIRSDVGAGYLQPIDDHLDGWADWEKFAENAKVAGQGDDGKVYGIPMGTDTRGLWFHKEILSKAGLGEDWQPTTWDELLEAAREIKSKVPDVIPFNIYSGKPMGEGSVMQGFEMLLYGVEGGSLYNTDQGKWVLGAQGFKDSLHFIRTVFTEELGPTPQQALDSNVGSTVGGEWLPDGKLGIALDGSWMPGTWLEDGAAPWPEWSEKMGAAAMPTQTGAEPGQISMSGGWTLAMGANCEDPDLAFQVMSLALDKEHSLAFAISNSQIAVREDVAADPSYLESNPTVEFFSDLVEVTQFRPATADYPNISNAIMVAMESVMTGKTSPEEAAATYDQAVVDQVGEDQTVAG